VFRLYWSVFLIILSQVLLAALYKCQRHAHSESGSELSFYEWVAEMSEHSDMFFYWSMVMRFQSLFLVFLRSIREGNWKLNVSARMMVMKYAFIFIIEAMATDNNIVAGFAITIVYNL